MSSKVNSGATMMNKSIVSERVNSGATMIKKSTDGLGTTVMNKSIVSIETEVMNKSAEVVEYNDKGIINKINDLLPDPNVGSKLRDIFSDKVNEIHLPAGALELIEESITIVGYDYYAGCLSYLVNDT